MSTQKSKEDYSRRVEDVLFVPKKESSNKSWLFGIATIIVSLAIGYYFVIYLPQKERQRIELLQKQEQQKKILNQQSFDKCMIDAYRNYRNDERDRCWFYNHDATECDLEYMKRLGLEAELPSDKLEKDIKNCEKNNPAESRLYIDVSPGIEKVITPPGVILERDAFKKVMVTEEYKDFLKPRDLGKYSVEVTLPKEDNQYWMFRLYYFSNKGEDTTFARFEVDANTGELKKI